MSATGSMDCRISAETVGDVIKSTDCLHIHLFFIRVEFRFRGVLLLLNKIGARKKLANSRICLREVDGIVHELLQRASVA